MMQTENPHRRPHRAVDGGVAGLLGIGGGERRGVPLFGVRDLMLAMLEDAVRSYLGALPRCREEAEAWIDSRPQRWVFSFATVCESLGLEPAAVRTALRRLRDEAPGPRAFFVARSRPNARRVNLRITPPRVRRRRSAPRPPGYSAGGSE